MIGRCAHVDTVPVEKIGEPAQAPETAPVIVDVARQCVWCRKVLPVSWSRLTALTAATTMARTAPLHPCEYGHAWAWAALVRGGARQLCYRCGAAR